jgi:hypothetical protein
VPEPEQGIDRVGSVVAAAAEVCLHDLEGCGSSPRRHACLRARGAWTVVVFVAPAPPGGPPADLTPCEVDCLAYLRHCTDAVPARRVRDRMEELGIGVHGLSTVKRALIRLCKLGCLTCSHCSRRGYRLASSAAPLFDEPRGKEPNAAPNSPLNKRPHPA